MSTLIFSSPAAAVPHTPATSDPPAQSTALPEPAVAPPPRRGTRPLAALLVLESVLALAPVAVLGAAIGWPASLDWPAARQLAAVAAAPGGVMAGYGLYLLYSLLILPLMIGLAARLPGGLASPLGASVAAFGAASALARGLGILRWLTVMPALAAAHASAGPTERERIEALFTALTTYGGGIGEVLGVSLLMALSLGPLCVAALLARRGGARAVPSAAATRAVAARAGTVPRPPDAHRPGAVGPLPAPLAAPTPTMPVSLALLGVVVSLLLAGLALPTFGAPLAVPVALAVSLLSLWMLWLGLWLWRRG